MNGHYICPKCRGHLTVEDHVVFSGKTKNGKMGLLFFDLKLNNSAVVKHPDFTFNEGDHVHLYCPICHADVEAKEIHDSLARVIQVDPDGKEHQIIFSKVIGEQCTYKVSDDTIKTFGEAAHLYHELLADHFLARI